ncbi:MAG TPA: hypothetical protein VME92_19870 [Acetobacteraceae bacterium]|nr:hypothetical protein [Acetobacteraceae bacterium]
MSDVQSVAADILKVLEPQARSSFAGLVRDVETHVLPSMAMIAQSLATVGAQRVAGTISEELASLEIDGLRDAAASVIVGFANTTLQQVQAVLNAVLAAVAASVNRLVGIALLP